VAIKQIFQYTSNEEGVDFLNFTDWVNTLTDSEKAEVQQALAAFNKIEKALVRTGKLIVEFVAEGKIYTWADEADVEVGIPEPLIWQTYHQRYLEENNITLEIITETV